MNPKVICAVIIGGCFLALSSAGPAIDHESGGLSNSVRILAYLLAVNKDYILNLE